jgi:hypothetical protein
LHSPANAVTGLYFDTMLQISKPILGLWLQQCQFTLDLLRLPTMRHLLLTAVLLAVPLWGVAGPANGLAAQAQGGVALPELPLQVEQSKDQRRAALRQALVLRKDAAPPAQPDSQTARQLSPAERAELRRQLRDQSSR